ncbi:amidohydrolase family protein, partial [Enterobacter hormaechei]
GMYAQRLGVARAAGLNPFALLASQGVPLAFGSDSPVTDMNPWAAVRAATRHQTPGSAISARAAFAAATRGAWRAGGVRDGLMGTLVPGAPAT